MGEGNIEVKVQEAGTVLLILGGLLHLHPFATFQWPMAVAHSYVHFQLRAFHFSTSLCDYSEGRGGWVAGWLGWLGGLGGWVAGWLGGWVAGWLGGWVAGWLGGWCIKHTGF